MLLGDRDVAEKSSMANELVQWRVCANEYSIQSRCPQWGDHESPLYESNPSVKVTPLQESPLSGSNSCLTSSVVACRDTASCARLRDLNCLISGTSPTVDTVI